MLQILENISLSEWMYTPVGNVLANIGKYFFICVDFCLSQRFFANIQKYFFIELIYIHVGNVLTNIGKYIFFGG